MDLVLRGGTVVTMDARRRVLEGDVLVSDGAIAAIGAVKAPRGARVVDCRGRVVLPGLIHGHVHLCQALFRNQADGLPLLAWLRKRIWPLEAAHDEASLLASARLALAELIRSGATGALDMGTVHGEDAVFEAARGAGFRLTSGKAMMDAGAGLPRGLRERTADSLAESDRLRATWDGAEGGRLRYAYAPRFALSTTEKLSRAVAERGHLVHTHASEHQDECAAVRAKFGHDNVELLHRWGLGGPRSTFAHVVHPTTREVHLLAESGTTVAHCPSANLKLASGVAPVPEFVAAGVHVALGADGAPCNNRLDIWEELRLAALLPLPRVGAAGFSPQRVLEMATLGGARALGAGDLVGSLEPGKRADISVVDMSGPHAAPAGRDVYARLVYCARASDVRTVLVDGRVLLDEGALTTLDEGAVVAQAGRQLARVLRRAGLS